MNKGKKGAAIGYFLVCKYWPPGNVNTEEEFKTQVQKQVEGKSEAMEREAGWRMFAGMVSAFVAFVLWVE